MTKVVLSSLAIACSLAITAAHAQTDIPEGSWRATGSLGEARHSACTVTLGDGTAMVTGGIGVSDRLAWVEVYQPENEAFRGVPPMNTPRARHTCTLLKDGRVLVTGGEADGKGSAEVYDPVAQSWSAIQGTGFAMEGHTATLLETGMVLLVSSNGLAVFEPAGNALLPLAARLRTARAGFATVLLSDGRVLVIGGESDGVPLSSTEVFDPVTFAVTAGPALHVGRSQHSATMLDDGRVLVVGGLAAEAETGSAEILDPAAPEWTLVATALREARRGHLAIAIPDNGGVLIAGGMAGDTVLASTEMFRPETDAFVAFGDLTIGRTGMSGAALSQGRVLAIGGKNEQGPQAACGITQQAIVQFRCCAFEHPSTMTAIGLFPLADTSASLSLSRVRSGIGDTGCCDISERLLNRTIRLTRRSELGASVFESTPIAGTTASDVGRQIRLSASGVPSLASASSTTRVISGVSYSPIAVTPASFPVVNGPVPISVTMTPTVDAGPFTGQVSYSSSDGNIDIFVGTTLAGTAPNPLTVSNTLTYRLGGIKRIRFAFSGDSKYRGGDTTTEVTIFDRNSRSAALIGNPNPPAGVPIEVSVLVASPYLFDTAPDGAIRIRGLRAGMTPPAPTGLVTLTGTGNFREVRQLSSTSTPGVSRAIFSFTPSSTAPVELRPDYGGDPSYSPNITATPAVIRPVPGLTSLTFVNPPGTYSCSAPTQLVARLTYPGAVALATRTVALGTSSAAGAFTELFTTSNSGSVPVTATLAPGSPTGQATATFSTTLPPGLTSLQARFPGDLNLSPALTAIPLAMQKISPTAQLAMSQSAPAILTATFNKPAANTCPVPAPSGTVRFFDGSLLLGVGQLDSSGSARLLLPTRPSGVRTLSASYAGDGNYGAATATQTVTFP